MERELFSQWLREKKNQKEGTASSRVSNCQRIENVYGDLDKHYDKDRLETILNDFNNLNHKIKIDGDFSSGTSTLKQALNLYIEFKNDNIINHIEKKERLNDFLQIPEEMISNYKIKLNTKNREGVEPIDLILEDEEAKHRWMGWKYKTNELSRDYVIGLVRDYKMGPEFWRFIGVFKILERYEDVTDEVGYKLEELEEYNEYKNILLLNYKNTSQNLIRNAETIIDEFKVVKQLVANEGDLIEERTVGKERLKVIVDAFKKIGGKGKANDIFDIVKDNPRFKFHKFANDSSAEGTIRLIIQEHSSDAQTYKSNNEDLFYSVDGIGKGLWGLRERKIKLMDIDLSLPLDLDSLYFEDKDILKNQISVALKSGKSIILIGPPGTGKSKLAKCITESYRVDSKMVTAMSDWSSYDTIGGYKPDKEGVLYFEDGIFLSSLKDRTGNNINKWLIIDEINRADIDKAFGPFFSALSGDDIELGLKDNNGNNIELLLEKNLQGKIQTNSNQYIIPKDWRIIGTMNTFDKTSLYEMSYAFMRRFAFIPVAIPKIIDSNLVKKLSNIWKLRLEEQDFENISILWKTINRYRKIGPALIEDIAKFIELNGDYTSNVIIYILPQLEGIFDDKLKTFYNDLTKLSFINDKERLKNSIEDFFNITLGEE